jgi:hypothetical protein
MLFFLQIQPGENVITEGDDGDNFYVIERLNCSHLKILAVMSISLTFYAMTVQQTSILTKFFHH